MEFELGKKDRIAVGRGHCIQGIGHVGDCTSRKSQGRKRGRIKGRRLANGVETGDALCLSPLEWKLCEEGA